jgi:primosomal protein N' (replication factor Y)
MTKTVKRVRVAVPVPVGDGFDYRWDGPGPTPAAGTRVRVPFGTRERIGVVIDAVSPSPIDAAALKSIAEVLDDEPAIDARLMTSLQWAAAYYHHPLGEVLGQALPNLIRQGRSAEAAPETGFRLTPAGREADCEALSQRAPRQAELLRLLKAAPIVSAADIKQAKIASATVRGLIDRHWVVAADIDRDRAAVADRQAGLPADLGEAPPELTPDQRAAVDAMRSTSGFRTALLFGVTGSGKTEVFLRLIRDALDQGRQCPLLVPEIGLTPQLVARLAARFRCRLAVFHSGLTPTERLRTWRQARSGEARLIVGTRSAAFAPLKDPGLIVVDEEHDPSYKQQSGFRYSGRDLAIVRARAYDIPIVLASATPSLESFRNAAEGRYRLLTLPQRIGAGGRPDIRIIDLNQHAARQGLSTPLVAAMEQHLANGNQVLLFINRRGFAPVLFCPNCATSSECQHCDSRMTVHAGAAELRCHHCGRREALRWACPTCGGERIGVGAGTERVTSELEALFPDHEIARLDRDVVVGREALGKALAEIESGAASIIVGTQLLTKGHDFPSVTLVGVLNADQGLFGTDFRSEERLAQTIVQVAGRAGRRDQRGVVLVQTHYPQHPLLTSLLTTDYGAFAGHALTERRATGWPPFSHLAVFRAEAKERDRVFALLRQLKQHCTPGHADVAVLGPTPDWMERRDGRFRAQLLLSSANRSALHRTIRSCLQALAEWPKSHRVRWSIDVDPAEL